MNILYSIHLYFPFHKCGAERYVHNLNKFLVSRGHTVRVIIQQAAQYKIEVPYTIDGVEVLGPGDNEVYNWADVFITHLEETERTIARANLLDKPVIQIVHNSTPYQCVYNGHGNINIIYNSHWIEEKLAYEFPSMVLQPPCDWREFDVCEDSSKNEFITLINLNENKGAETFWNIARSMPEKKFLAVKGGYDHQILKGLMNVEVIDNTPDILDVYKRTRILLMPSKLESWGLVATEAICNGIPVIASPTPGISENIGTAGLYHDRRDTNAWVRQIRALDNPGYYKQCSEASRKRSRELEPTYFLKQTERFIKKICQPSYV